MALAQIGLLTTVMEALATAVGAGMLLGGFVVGSAQFVLRRGGSKLEQAALAGGYVGGLVAAGAVLFDLAIRYG